MNPQKSVEIRGACLLLAGTLLGAMTFGGCSAEKQESAGSVERLDVGLDSIIGPRVRVEVIGRGFNWSEGPLWVEQEHMLLFSDVPENIVYKWTEEHGVEPYLTPSGYTSTTPRGGETGSNGLLLAPDGHLLLCQHGDRRLALMDAPLDNPAPRFLSLADNYQGKKFNSPNDAVLAADGDVFFTDPPYGLEKGLNDPLRELPFQGVYKVGEDGNVTLLDSTISRPNGIALTPDGKTLIVANSDPSKAAWFTFGLGENDSLINRSVLLDVTAETGKAHGLPDGLKIDSRGTLFASGPGGIWIFAGDQKLLGKIKIPGVASNCSLSGDEKTLFITADSLVLRVKMR